MIPLTKHSTMGWSRSPSPLAGHGPISARARAESKRYLETPNPVEGRARARCNTRHSQKKVRFASPLAARALGIIIISAHPMNQGSVPDPSPPGTLEGLLFRAFVPPPVVGAYRDAIIRLAAQDRLPAIPRRTETRSRGRFCLMGRIFSDLYRREPRPTSIACSAVPRWPTCRSSSRPSTN